MRNSNSKKHAFNYTKYTNKAWSYKLRIFLLC